MSLFRKFSLSFGCIFLVFAVFAIFITSSLSSSSAYVNGLSEYRGNGLSFEYPAEWAVTAFGKSSGGNLSIQSQNACIFLAWIRDPGSEPRKRLDSVEKTYGGDEKSIISSAHSWIRMNSGNASVLDLYYSMRGYNTRKRFAVWNSSLSDRQFFATLSSSNESYNVNIMAFNHMLKTFLDIPEREATKLEQRAVKGDDWAIVLGDLLASYSYRDASAPQIGKVYLKTRHSLVPINGTYQLYSTDELTVDPPLAIAIRAFAVQDLLNSNGYQTRLIQRGGNIWVEVQDASAKWQRISLNPKEPERMIGVPIDDEVDGIVYRNISGLAKDNLMEFDYSKYNSSQIIRMDCEPPRYVELKQPSIENKSWEGNLQKILDGYNYSQSYRNHVFDCSNTSQICWSILQSKGYDARLMWRSSGYSADSHMWIVVRYPYETERYVAVEATNTDENDKLLHLGTITMNKDHYYGIMFNSSVQFSKLRPNEGMWIVDTKGNYQIASQVPIQLFPFQGQVT